MIFVLLGKSIGQYFVAFLSESVWWNYCNYAFYRGAMLLVVTLGGRRSLTPMPKTLVCKCCPLPLDSLRIPSVEARTWSGIPDARASACQWEILWMFLEGIASIIRSRRPDYLKTMLGGTWVNGQLISTILLNRMCLDVRSRELLTS